MHGIPWEELALQQREAWTDEFLDHLPKGTDIQTIDTEDLEGYVPHEAAALCLANPERWAR